MNAHTDLSRDLRERPIGSDAPRHSVEWANYTAACIAARQVAVEAKYCDLHRASLDAWRKGKRAWPWPDPTPEQQAAADNAVLGTLNYLRLTKDEKQALTNRGRV